MELRKRVLEPALAVGDFALVRFVEDDPFPLGTRRQLFNVGEHTFQRPEQRCADQDASQKPNTRHTRGEPQHAHAIVGVPSRSQAPCVATSKLGVICLRDENQVGADLFGERIAIFTVRSNSLHTRV